MFYFHSNLLCLFFSHFKLAGGESFLLTLPDKHNAICYNFSESFYKGLVGLQGFAQRYVGFLWTESKLKPYMYSVIPQDAYSPVLHPSVTVFRKVSPEKC